VHTVVGGDPDWDALGAFDASRYGDVSGSVQHHSFGSVLADATTGTTAANPGSALTSSATVAAPQQALASTATGNAAGTGTATAGTAAAADNVDVEALDFIHFLLHVTQQQS
jgi:hypothetical protein